MQTNLGLLLAGDESHGGGRGLYATGWTPAMLKLCSIDLIFPSLFLVGSS